MKKHAQGYVLTPKAGNVLEDVLKEILALHIQIEQFGLYEPTLTEIFVEKAGDEA